MKFSDGSALLLISAEDYRFEDSPGAQGFDSIVRELDKPKLVSNSGSLTYVYTEIDTEFMIANTGTKLVIGGIEKRSIMQISSGIPILKDLPGLGWVFSTETEAIKRSQLLVVAEVLPVDKAENKSSLIKSIEGNLAKAGKINAFGYRQYFVDSNRK